MSGPDDNAPALGGADACPSLPGAAAKRRARVMALRGVPTERLVPGNSWGPTWMIGDRLTEREEHWYERRMRAVRAMVETTGIRFPRPSGAPVVGDAGPPSTPELDDTGAPMVKTRDVLHHPNLRDPIEL